MRNTDLILFLTADYTDGPNVCELGAIRGENVPAIRVICVCNPRLTYKLKSLSSSGPRVHSR